MKSSIAVSAMIAVLSFGSAAGAQSSLCYSVEPSFNISRGDVVLTTASDGVIKDLVSALGQLYTHTGMALSGSDIRHNSMEVALIQTVASKGLRLVPSRLKAVGGSSLRDGRPGMRTDRLDTHGFRASTSLVLTGPPEHWFGRHAAASAMESMDGYYRLYAYTDMNWSDPQLRLPDSGNMCSGSIARAHELAGQLPAAMRVTYTAEVRDAAAKVLHNSVRKRASKAIPELLGYVLRNQRIDTITNSVANQVVNCMAFNDCGNTSNRWASGVGTGSTLSPDNLIDVMHVMWLGSALWGTPNTFPYQWIAPVEVQSPLYCCRTDITQIQCN
jgi:hypothetical protein